MVVFIQMIIMVCDGPSTPSPREAGGLCRNCSACRMLSAHAVLEPLVHQCVREKRGEEGGTRTHASFVHTCENEWLPSGTRKMGRLGSSVLRKPVTANRSRRGRTQRAPLSPRRPWKLFTAVICFSLQSINIMELTLQKYGSYEKFEQATGGSLLSKTRIWSHVRRYMAKEGCMGEVRTGPDRTAGGSGFGARRPARGVSCRSLRVLFFQPRLAH